MDHGVALASTGLLPIDGWRAKAETEKQGINALRPKNNDVTGGTGFAIIYEGSAFADLTPWFHPGRRTEHRPVSGARLSLRLQLR